jgi:hypothetical protein
MTDTEQYIRDQLQSSLREGEQIVHTGAFARGVAGGGISPTKGYLAALTNQRLLLIHTRVGAFKPLLENEGMTEIELANIRAVAGGAELSIRFHEGEDLELRAAAGSKKHAPETQALQQALIASYGQSEEAKALARGKRRSAILSLVLGLGVAAAFIAYREYFGKAGVEVRCQPRPGVVACELRHVKGAASCKSCWDIAVSCKNGTRSIVNACGNVKAKGTTQVDVPESSFPSLDKCDEAQAIKIENIKVTLD